MKLMISCEKATELVEKRAAVGINPLELLHLRFHNLICKGCKIYENQSKLIDEIFKQKLDINANIKELSNTHDFISNITNEKLKEKILNNLK